MEWTGSIRWIHNQVQSRWIWDWTGSEIYQLSGFWIGLDPEMCNVYPIFRDLRQFLLIVTLTSEVLSSNLSYTIPRLFFHVYFTSYLVDTYSVVSDWDWLDSAFWVISWIGLD